MIVEVDVVTVTRKWAEIHEVCPDCGADLTSGASLRAWVHGDATYAAHLELPGAVEEDTPPENFDESGVLQYRCAECDRVLVEGGFVFGEGC